MLNPNNKKESRTSFSSGRLFSLIKASTRIKGSLKSRCAFVRDNWFSPANRFNKKALSGPALAADINGLRHNLREILKKIEPKFIRLGQKLQTIYADSKGLGQLTVSAAQTIEGDTEQSLLVRIGNLARRSLEDLQNSQKEIDQSLGKVDQGVEHLAGLYRMCAAIDKTAMVLHVVGLNIAVESCASLESRAMFRVFVEEIKQLSQKMNVISQNIRNDSSKTYNDQLSAHQKILEGLAQLQSLTTAAEKTVADAVTRINQLMTLSFKGLEKAGHISREISRQVGEIVVSIQFHDITRQQIEHIVEALQDAEHLFQEQNASNRRQTGQSRNRNKAYSILLLQLEQLKHVIVEIDNARQKAQIAFEKIGLEILNLVESLNSSDSEAAGTGQEQDPFLALKAGLENLAGLFNQGRDLSRQMEEIADHASLAASTLTKHIDQVRGISMDLHLKALNAIVKTAHLNDKGKTLEVLAQEVNRLSNQSIAFVDNVVGILESITYLAKALAEHTWSDTHARSGTDASLTDGIEAVAGAYERFKTDTQTITKYSEDLKSAIREIRAELDFLSELAARLNLNMNALQGMVSGLAHGSDKASATPDHEIHHLSKRYTMQKERDIHEDVVKNRAAPAQPAAAETAALPLPAAEGGGNEKELGDNVDLF